MSDNGMTTTPELKYFHTGEVAINYAEWPGEKPAYLFIHGLTDWHETWLEVIDPIRQGSKAIAVDLRGHGRSGHVACDYTPSEYAHDIATLMEGLGLGPCLVVGHSLGALTTIELAANNPQLVRAIVLEDPPIYGQAIIQNDDPAWRLVLDRNAEISASGLSVEGMAGLIASGYPDADEEFVRQVAPRLFMTDAKAISRASDLLTDSSMELTREIEECMRAVQCPVLLMQANMELGGRMRAGDGKRAIELMTNCEVVLWDDAGHGLHPADPGRYVKQVNEFVAKMNAAERSV